MVEKMNICPDCYEYSLCLECKQLFEEENEKKYIGSGEDVVLTDEGETECLS